MKPKVGDRAPDFSLCDQNGKIHKLSDYKGKWILVYFYPKDFTPGCTVEACSIRDHFSQIKKLGLAVLGISTDSQESHSKFSQKLNLPFPILADTQKTAVRDFGVWGNKGFFGKVQMGIFRTSYLVDPEGKIAKVYERVKPPGHAQKVLTDMSSLSS